MKEATEKSQRYEKEAEFIRQHREKLQRSFLDETHRQSARNWGIPMDIYDFLVTAVLKMDSSSIEKAIDRYNTTPHNPQKPALEIKRQLLLSIEYYTAGRMSLK